jgi:hypothetical protein
MLFFFLNNLNTRLAGLPAFTTLLEFIEELRKIFQDLNALSKADPEETRQQLRDLQMLLGFVTRGNNVNSGHALRVFRHMIYGHPSAIKQYLDQIQDGSKELQLDHTARIRILVAKCLSKARIPSEQRSKILETFPLEELEKLLITPIREIKKQLAQNVRHEPRELSKREREPDPLEKFAHSYIKIHLNRSPLMTLEIDQMRLKKWRANKEHQIETLATFLEKLYGIDPESSDFAKILEIVQSQENSPE